MLRHNNHLDKQILLFTRTRPNSASTRPAPLARSSDALSSHIAAREVTLRGRRDSQKREILAALGSHSDTVTSMELARAAGMDRYIVARRLPDLDRDGLVKRCPMRDCAETRRPAITWRAKEAE